MYHRGSVSCTVSRAHYQDNLYLSQLHTITMSKINLGIFGNDLDSDAM